MPRQNPAIKQQLATWYLKRAPFPSISFVNYFSSDPLVNGSVFARDLREHQLKQIRHDLLAEGFPQGVKRWDWIWARKNMGKSIGMGKTALLAYICDQINKDFGKTFFGHAANWLALYVPVQPGARTMDEIAAYALASLCDESHGTTLEQRLLARLRHQVIVRNRENHYPSGHSGTVWHHFVNDAWLVAQGIDRNQLDADVERLLLECHVSAQIARAISRCALGTYLAKLNGNPNLIPVSASLQRQASGILLNDIARVAETATIAKVTLFLDDFYFAVRALPPSERRPLADRIRKIALDGPSVSAKTGIFNWIAVMHTQTAHTFFGSWHEAGVDMYAPLKWDEDTSVLLRGFTPQQAGDLLRAYLSYRPHRISGAPDTIYPFSDQALQAIVASTHENDFSENDPTIVPRGLMEAAHKVFTKALEEKPQAPIGPEFVAHVLEGIPLPTPSEDDEMETADTEEQYPTIRCPCECHDENGPHDVIAVLSGSNGARRIVRLYCRNCNDEVVIEAHAG